MLVVYGSDRLYHDLCLEMATETLKVVDASKSSITSREEALKTMKQLGSSNTALKTMKQLGSSNTALKGFLIYVPAKAPETDEEKQIDPFSLYSVCGSVFPDGVGDEYMHICLKAKPDHGTEIRRIFSENPIPAFAVIDAVGGGKGSMAFI